VFCRSLVSACGFSYVLQDDPTDMKDLAVTLITTAMKLCASPHGVFCFVYTPRYRGMGVAIKAACAQAGVSMRTIHRNCILSDEQRSTGKFYTIRTVVVSPWPDALTAFCEALEPGGVSDEEDWLNGDTPEELDPLSAMGSDVFAE
jgi:hypothetical protein